MAEKFVVSANQVWEILNPCYSLPLIRILPQINEIIYFFKENPAESDVNARTSGRVEGGQSLCLGSLGTYDPSLVVQSNMLTLVYYIELITI